MATVIDKENVHAESGLFGKSTKTSSSTKKTFGVRPKNKIEASSMNGFSLPKDRISCSKRAPLGDLKNVSVNGKNKNVSSKEEATNKSVFSKLPKKVGKATGDNTKTTDKFELANIQKVHEDREDIELCPGLAHKPDTFEDILPVSERVASSFPPDCFDKLFMPPRGTPAPFDPSVWCLEDLLPTPTVDELLKDVDDLYSDPDYPISDSLFLEMKELCEALRD